ncbi:MAG: type IX secretion system sortase PorU [Bacteroidia bacterium]
MRNNVHFISLTIVNFLGLFLLSGLALAQNVNLNDSISWTSPQEIQISKYDVVKKIHFKGAQYSFENADFPYLSGVKAIKNGTEVKSVKLGRAVFSSLSQDEKSLIRDKTSITNQVAISFGTVYDKGKAFAEYRITPFRETGGVIEKLISFELIIETARAEYQGRAKSTTTQSILNSGDWVKIGVTNSGVYKISRDLLASYGVNVSGNPRNIRVFGNGGTMVPERNNSFYPDDLAENAIYIEGESDGSFDASDYILFYAQGPVDWNYDNITGVFKHTKNLYADTAWYFISASSDPGKRIQTQAQVEGVPNSVVTTFDDYGFVENDDENLLKSGRRWYGNKMESGVNSHSFNFSFPNATAGPHKFISKLASRYLGNGGAPNASFSININGQAFSQNVSGLNSLNYLDSFAKENETVFTVNGSLSNANVSVTKGSSSAIGWIDYLIFNVERNLSVSGSQMTFRKQSATQQGTTVEYRVANSNSSIQIWETTNIYDVKRQLVDLSGSMISFKATADSLREWTAVNLSGTFPSPINGGSITNQNLHGLAVVDFVIVAPSIFVPAANKLADHHREHDNMSVAVVTPEQIYNEFSSGSQDIGGIRNFMRMFYERASSPEEGPKNILLFGDGSYDFKYRLTNNQNWVPTFQSIESLNPIGSFCTDDFFGFLDPTEGGNIQSVGAGLMDLGVGRFPVNTVAEANAVVNKVIHYATSLSTMNDWRNRITFVADDEDNGTHVNQAEDVSNVINNSHPVYNIDKIYLDAYQQDNGAGGQRYPQVNTDITNRIERGGLMMNYAGHGGEQSLALERVITIPEINAWQSLENLTLFMTATCEFSRFDNPDFTSAGEYVILNPTGGGVGLFTTLRLTFSSSNAALNRNIMNVIFLEEGANDEHLRLGEILRRGKNATGSSFNNRSFALLGDPALKLAYPKYDVFTTKINGVDISAVPDTIGALDMVTVEGIVTNSANQILEDFNGIVIPTVYDKAATYYTLSNDGVLKSPVIPFQLRKNVIFRGPATVTNGKFSFTFVVPQDIQFNYGTGKISYYAKKNNSLDDAHGYLSEMIVGGFSNNPTTDDQGPQLRLYMNNEQFVDGGITDENPIFLAYAEDDIGINTVGTGIGHDITAILDENTSNPIVLNDFYEAELDNFRKGKITYPLRNLSEGEHTISLKVWDVANNSATASLRFVVVKAEDLSLDHVLNYPNPFTTNTQFFFEYNQPGVPVDVDIQIFTVSGKTVTTLRSTQVNTGYRSEPIVWNGLDDYGDRIGRGVYMYRLRVKTPDGKSAEKFEKLVILQ